MINRYRTILALAVIILFAGGAYSATIHVPADQLTIQAGINAAVNGDTVLVAPGTYIENISFLGKNIAVYSIGGPNQTTISAANITMEVVSFKSGEPKGAEINGFNITGGGKSGIFCKNSSPTIRNNIITGNHSTNGNDGAGIILNNSSNSMITANYIYNNNAATYAPAISVGDDTTSSNSDTICYNVMYDNIGYWDIRILGNVNQLQIFNNTIKVTSYGGIVDQGSNPANIRNNIVFNAPQYGIGGVLPEYNCMFDNLSNFGSSQPGEGNIYVDAQFIDPLNANYHLNASSPCIDAGDPNPIYNDPNGTRNDIGALPFYHPNRHYIAPNGSDVTGDGTEVNPYATIQKGINMADDGDSIMIMPGVYSGAGNRDINTQSKSLCIIGAIGEENAVIDAEGHDGLIVFIADTLDGVQFYIDGLTIRNSTYGLLVNMEYSYAINNVYMTNCYLSKCDRGIRCVNSGAGEFLIFNAINSRIDSSKVGLYALTDNRTINVLSCQFINCDTGIYLPTGPGSDGECHIDSSYFDSNMVSLIGTFNLYNSTISNGERGTYGELCDPYNHQVIDGCIYQYLTDCAITATNSTAIRNSIIRNISGQTIINGWGSDCGGAIEIENCIFENNNGPISVSQLAKYTNNVVRNCNTGIYLSRSALAVGPIENSIFYNIAGDAITQLGGGEDYNIIGCTIAGNGGSGIVANSPSYPINLINSQIINNTGAGLLANNGSNIIASCCNILSNAGGDFVGIPNQTGQNGNISLNPMFCDSANDNYQIYDVSPCAPNNNSCHTLIGALGVGCISDQTVWYISPEGDDIFGDGSLSNPLAAIQSGVNIARNGDTVMLLPGTYAGNGNWDVSYMDKSIIVKSLTGENNTIIDCTDPDQHRAFILAENDTCSFRLEGVSIIGSDDYAIYSLYEDTIIIENCVFYNNYGGGIFSYNVNAIHLNNCVFSNNSGVGIYISESSDGIISNCQLFGNTTGLRCEYGRDSINSCNISNNSFRGIEWRDFSGVIYNCDINNNAYDGILMEPGCKLKVAYTKISENGHYGFYNEDGNLTCLNCEINYNTQYGIASFNEAGAPNVYLDTCTFIGNGQYGLRGHIDSIKNSIFIHNYEGAIFEYSWSYPDIDNCIFLANSHEGGSVIRVNLFQTEITNSIIAYNYGTAISCEVDAMIPLVTCCNIFSNSGGDWADCIIDQYGQNGNISLDPKFCDTANGDYHIFDISPCAPANNSCGVLIGALGVGCNMPLPNIEALRIDNQSPAMNLVDHTPLFEWDFAGSKTYAQTLFEIAVGTDNDWQYSEMWNPAPFNSPDTFVTYGGAALQDGQTYYLRLRVNNGYIWSDWYETTFRMNSVPSVPVLVDPLNDEIVLTATPTLTLQAASDPEGDILTYDFIYITDPAFGPVDSSFIFGVNDISLLISGPLNDNWRYSWAARSYDGFEYSAWSAPASFWINSINQAPSGFAALNPPGEPPLPIYNMLPAFIWSASNDPDPFNSVHYALILATDEDFNFALTIDSIWDETYTLTDSLSFATQYWWKVRAKDTYGLTTFSDNVRTFKTWRLGDVNNDWRFDILDIIFTIDYKFKNGAAPNPIYTGDVNADCVVNILDIIYMIDAKFKTGPDPLVGCE